MGNGEPGPGQGKIGITLDRYPVPTNYLFWIHITSDPHQLLPLEVGLVGLHVSGGGFRLGILQGQGHPELIHNLGGDGGLNVKDVFQFLVVLGGPQVGAVGNPDQLGIHPDPARSVRTFLPAHRPLHHIVHAQLVSNFLDGFLALGVVHGAGPGNHSQPSGQGQTVHQFLGDSSGKVGILGRTQVFEGKNHDHLPTGFCRSGFLGVGGRALCRGLFPTRPRLPDPQHPGQHHQRPQPKEEWSAVGARRDRRHPLHPGHAALFPQSREFVLKIRGDLIPSRRILGQTVGDDPGQMPGEFPVEFVYRGRFVLQDRGDGGDSSIPLKRPLSRGHLVENNAHGKNVGSGIDGFALGLLRRHVGRGAQNLSLCGHAAIANHGGTFSPGVRRHELGQTEVQHLYPAFFVEHDVYGFQIAVGDSLGMGITHGLGKRNGYLQKTRQRKPAGGDLLGQGPTLHQFHDQEQIVPILFHRIDGHDVGMLEGSHRHGLADETLPVIGIGGGVRGENLDRHVSVELGIPGAVDLAHTPGAQRGQNFVMGNGFTDHASGGISGKGA